MPMLPMLLSSNIAAADAVANVVSLCCKTCNRLYNAVCQHATGRVATRIRACGRKGERGAFKIRALWHASIPAKSARAALCCANAEPAAG
eukprot:697698-Pleurochrysis_carterae.AAC.1